MSRGLPISILIHVLTLGLVLVFGNSVNQKQFEMPRTIGVRLVELPKVKQPEKTVEPIKLQEQPKPKPKPKVQEDLAPKELPKPKPDPKPKPKPDKIQEVIPEKDPVVEKTADPVDTPADSQEPAVVLPAGASVAGTDTNFPYAWYLTLMEGQVARNWNPKQMGFRNSSIYCVVHFTIQRSGAVTQLTLTRSSGIGVFDRDAMRAVQSIRLGPLPGEFGSNTVGVSMTFNLESDDR